MTMTALETRPYPDHADTQTQSIFEDVEESPDSKSANLLLFSKPTKIVTHLHPRLEPTHPAVSPRDYTPELLPVAPPETQYPMGFLANLMIQAVLSHTQTPKRSNNLIEKEEIFATKSHDELLEILQKYDRTHLISEYESFLNQRQEDLEEGESPDIILQSLQSWVCFMIDCVYPDGLPPVRLRADFDGCARLIWRLSESHLHGDVDNEHWGGGRGIAVLKFFPSGLNYFSMMSGPFAPEKRRLTFEGYLSHDKTKKTISMFSERLLNAAP